MRDEPRKDARLEGGYRFATPFVAVAPYAALLAQSFQTPSYSEIGTIVDGFALSFASRDATDAGANSARASTSPGWSSLLAKFDGELALPSMTNCWCRFLSALSTIHG